jgi:hypothetical protein
MMGGGSVGGRLGLLVVVPDLHAAVDVPDMASDGPDHEQPADDLKSVKQQKV